MRIFQRELDNGRAVKIEANDEAGADIIAAYLNVQIQRADLPAYSGKVSYRRSGQSLSLPYSVEEWQLCQDIKYCPYCGHQYLARSLHRAAGDQVVLCLLCGTVFEEPGIKILPDNYHRFNFLQKNLS